jgi:hypothetical protein
MIFLNDVISGRDIYACVFRIVRRFLVRQYVEIILVARTSDDYYDLSVVCFIMKLTFRMLTCYKELASKY